MKYWIFVIISSFVVKPSIGQKVLENLQNIEKTRFEAMVKKDTSYLKEVLANDLVYIHSNGLLETKKDFLASINKGKIVYQSLQPEQIRPRLYGKTAVINGVVKVSGTLEGKAFELRLRYTDIYLKQKDKWQLVSWQSTKIP